MESDKLVNDDLAVRARRVPLRLKSALLCNHCCSFLAVLFFVEMKKFFIVEEDHLMSSYIYSAYSCMKDKQVSRSKTITMTESKCCVVVHSYHHIAPMQSFVKQHLKYYFTETIFRTVLVPSKLLFLLSPNSTVPAFIAKRV